MTPPRVWCYPPAMRVTLLGHASILVEMVDGTTCLMDPVFQDPFEEGAVVSCPKRSIDVARLPKIDVLLLSHAHLDHFDIPSLAQLDRSCDVLCPRDRQISYVLKELGFTSVHETEPNQHIVFDTHSFFTTRSHVSNVIELGVVFKDALGTFWNQVDTILFPETIAVAKEVCRAPDLLFAMFASQSFDYFKGRGAGGFPHKLHEMNLRNVAAIGPKLAVPGSAGFRFHGDAAWCNSHLFPISRERFLRDLGRVAPDVATAMVNPGDVLTIENGQVHHERSASPIARTLEDDTALLEPDPTAPVPPLVDTNPLGYPEGRLRDAVDACIKGFSAFLATSSSASDPLLEEYKRLRARYGVEILFPDGTSRRYRADLGQNEARLTAHDGKGAWEVDAAHRIAASALTAWTQREKSYFYFRLYSRPYSNLYTFAPSPDGCTIEPKTPQDLLDYFVTRKAEGADMALKTRLDKELARHVRR